MGAVIFGLEADGRGGSEGERQRLVVTLDGDDPDGLPPRSNKERSRGASVATAPVRSLLRPYILDGLPPAPAGQGRLGLREAEWDFHDHGSPS